MRVDAIVADLGADLGEGRSPPWRTRRSPACRCSTGATSSRHMTGRTPLGGLMPNEFGALLPSRQYLVVRRGHRAAADRAAAAGAAAGAADRGGDRAPRQSRPGVLRADPHRPARPAVPHDQVPHDVPRRRRAELHRPPSIRASPGSAASCAVPARRAAAALQCPARRHELGRAAAGGG